MSRRPKKNRAAENRDLRRQEKRPSGSDDRTARPSQSTLADGTVPFAKLDQPETQKFYKLTAICVFLLLVVVLVYGRTLYYGFVNYDDDQYVYNNPHVARGITARGFAWAFTTNHLANWHPLTWLSYMLDYQLYGLSPGGYHLSNVLLHAATAILLFLLLRQMTGELWPSAFAAAVFAVHPLRVESVAWVAERKDVLSGVFFMLTLWAYVGYVHHFFSLGRYLAVVALFALGLMAKPMLVTLPLVLLLLDWWPLGRMAPSTAENRRVAGNWRSSRIFNFLLLALEKVPLFAMSAASCAATLWAQRGEIVPSEHLSLDLRIGNALVSYVTYVGQFFYPADLVVFYPHPGSGLPMWKVMAATMLLAAICAGMIVLRRRCPYLLVGWLWYVVMLLPVIGLLQVGLQAMADRYTYLPQIGFCIAVAWGVTQITRMWPYRDWLCGVGAALVLAVLIGCSWRQTSYWRDSETLWTHALGCTSGNYVAHNGLGMVLADTGRTPEAIKHYQQALRLRPSYIEAYNNLGNALNNIGRSQEAIELYEQALRLKPDYAEVHFNLGLALAKTGQLKEAIKHSELTVQLKPDYAEAHYHLGILLGQEGRVQEAIEHYRQALRIKSGYVEVYNDLGNSFQAMGQHQLAIEHYEKALQLNPNYPEAHNNLGNALSGTGRPDLAIEHYQQTLRLKPDDPFVHNNLGVALFETGRLEQAIEHYQEALRLKPDYAEAYYGLAKAYDQTGRSSEVIPAFQKALNIARSKGQMELVKQIEDWLKSYQGRGARDEELGVKGEGRE